MRRPTPRARSSASPRSPTTSISTRPSRSRRFGGGGQGGRRQVGTRINPGYSNATLGGRALRSRVRPTRASAPRRAEIDQLPWSEIDIFHVHALCESMAEGSAGLIEHVAREFAPYIRKVKAVNFGGGHFVNKPGYDVAKLIAAIKAFRAAVSASR